MLNWGITVITAFIPFKDCAQEGRHHAPPFASFLHNGAGRRHSDLGLPESNEAKIIGI